MRNAYYYILCSLLFLSCTFEPEGLNYVEVEKPTLSKPFELSLSTDEDSIYLYANTRFSFRLSTFGKELNAAVIHLYDQTFTVNQPYYSFNISPQVTSDWVDLTIDFYVSTGSGSIADKLKAENHVMSRTWKIKYFDLSKEALTTGYSIHPEGYLELYMIPPKQNPGIEYGLSLSGNTIQASRQSGDTVFFSVKSYYGGINSYNLWFRIDPDHVFYRSVRVDLPYPELYFEPIGLDSCRVSWTKSPLKLYYTINETEYRGYDNEYKTSMRIYERKYFSLHVYPPDYPNQKYYSYYSVSRNFYMGTETNYFTCYSPVKDKFYLSKNIDLFYLESSEIPLPESETNAQYLSKVNIICSPNGKYIAGHLYPYIYIYNENLIFSKKIPADNIPNYRPYYSLTNDGVFTYLNGSTIVLKNISDNLNWESFSFSTDLDPNPNTVYFSVIANSIDGKYICVRGMNGFRIYDVSDHTTAKIVYDYQQNDIGALIAHPSDPGLIYVKQNGIMQLRTCPDFELVKTIDIPIDDYYFHSIDPYSKVMLMMTNEYYYFIDPETSKELLKVKCGSLWNYNVKLLHNQFIMYGSIFDLTIYLNK